MFTFWSSLEEPAGSLRSLSNLTLRGPGSLNGYKFEFEFGTWSKGLGAKAVCQVSCTHTSAATSALDTGRALEDPAISGTRLAPNLFSCNFASRDSNMTARHFFLTFNYGNETEVTLWDAMSIHDDIKNMSEGMVGDEVRYVCGGMEKGDAGNWHTHIYIQLNKSVRPTAIKKMFEPYFAPNVICCDGSDDECEDYVRKDGDKHADKKHTQVPDTIFTKGTRGKMGKANKGKRNELLVLENLLKQNKSERAICDDHFPLWARNFKIIDRYNVLHPPVREQAPAVEVHVGAPGTGKTRSVFDNNPVRDIFNVPRAQGTVWFDGYCPRESTVCLFDDFYGWAPYDFLLRVTDRYPLNVQVKNGFRPFVCPKIVFTSNKPPMEWYRELVEKGKVDFGAFLRRVTRWVAYHPGGVVYDGADYEAFSAALAMVPMRARSDSEATEVIDN